MIFGYDNEQNILIQTYLGTTNKLLLNGNSLEKRILKCIENYDKLTANNNHNDLPPDYYSYQYDMMFDITRLNDTEIRKGYNPHFIKEKELQKNASKILNGSEAAVIYDVESENINTHCYKNYKTMANRVIKNHISKIPIWENQFPKIKHKGLLIFDETECYFEGEPKFLHGKIMYKRLKLHKPWKDKNFMEELQNSKLDFVIWSCPYKQYSNATQNLDVPYPSVIIIDLRFKNISYEEYQEGELIL